MSTPLDGIPEDYRHRIATLRNALHIVGEGFHERHGALYVLRGAGMFDDGLDALRGRLRALAMRDYHGATEEMRAELERIQAALFSESP